MPSSPPGLSLLWECPKPSLSLTLSQLSGPSPVVPTTPSSEGACESPDALFQKNAAPWASLTGIWFTDQGWGPGELHA